jgi:NodT family efflux transporter outer membrane factor (OMF) lipoprotein
MIKNNVARGVSAGALAALLTACGHLPIARPAFDAMAEKRAGMPTDWTVAPMTGDTAAIVADYSVFNDPQLIAFVQEALENNRTLRAAVEAVKQSEASLTIARSSQWPFFRASAGARQSTLVDNFELDDTTYSFSFTGGYDIDIMGDINASVQASAAGLRSQQATYEFTRRQIAQQTARAYFSVIEQQLQLQLSQNSVARQRDTFRITQARFEAGSIAGDDLAQAEATLASSEAGIISQEAAVRSSIRALELILGRFPQNKITITGTLPEPPAAPPLGLPELTIRSRPDVVSAELNMISTFASNRIAQMGPWPQLDANLALSLSNATLNTTDDLFDFDDLAFSVGASIAQIIFDGGASFARVASSDAGKRAALERYGQTIIQAYGEIVGAMDQFNSLGARNTALQASSRSAAEALRLGELRYQEGSQSLLDLIQVRNGADNAEGALISNRSQRLSQWITLHAALGGNPTQSQPLPSPATLADKGRHEPRN